MSSDHDARELAERSAGFRGRLVFLNLLTAGVAVAIAVGALGVQQYFASRSDVGVQIEAIAQVVADNGAAALAFGDAKNAAEVLTALRALPEITRAGMYGQAGMLQEMRRQGVPPLEYQRHLAPRERELRFSINRVEVFKPALLAGRQVGMVYIQADLRRVYGRLGWFLGAAFLIVAASLSGAFLLLSRMRNRLTQAEEAVLRMNVSLEHRVAARTAELERANRELESFSYSVSHDLRAPLRAINGFASHLHETEKSRLTEAGARLLDRVVFNAAHMGQLIDDILEYSRAAQAQPERTRCELANMARGIAHELAEHYPRTHWEVQALPALRADRTMLHQILQNLIGNAFKYSAKVPQPRVEVFAQQLEGQWVIGVRDNGAGFDPATAQRLFGMFQRLHAANDFSGTGVGLAIVKRLVERHGGRVWAESSLGCGASFFFTLPDGPAAPE